MVYSYNINTCLWIFIIDLIYSFQKGTGGKAEVAGTITLKVLRP